MLWLQWKGGEIILRCVERKAENLLFLLPKKSPFLRYQDKDIWLLRHSYLGYPGYNDKTHLFTRVLPGLLICTFQNYQYTFCELAIQKR